jgi:hypothetical protein
MLFAAIIDVGLIPFLVFIILISHTQSIEPNNTPGHWTTLFGNDGATTKIVYSIFLLSVITGVFHVLSLIISIYLGVIFREIAQLPPDMNPLEDNLTSRHKRNKSSPPDNRMSQATTATANSQKEDSKADDPLISPPRTVPFMHTRNSSHENIMNVPHPNNSPKESRIDVSTPFYDQPPAHRSSRNKIQGPFYEQASYRSSRTNIQAPYYEQAPSHRSSRINVQSHIHDQPLSHHASRSQLHASSLDQVPIKQDFPIPTSTKQPSEPAITRSPTKSSSIYSSSTISTIATSTRPQSAAPSLMDSNWITHPSPSASPSPSPPRELKHLRNKSSYQPLSQTSPFEYTNLEGNSVPRPLEMNPPTPPIQQQKRSQAPGQRALTPVNGNAGQGSWDRPGTIGFGKARAWGGMGKSGGGMNNGGMGGNALNGNGNGMGGGGRVVSRSGVEVKSGGIHPSGGIRAREVSGKVMEEGRGNAGWM